MLLSEYLFLGDIALIAEKLSEENAAAGSTAECVVAEANELIVILSVLAQTADRNGHAAFHVAVNSGLGTVILGELVQELLGCGGKIVQLGDTLVLFPYFEDLFFGGFLFEACEYGCKVTVGDGTADALGGDLGILGGLDNAVFDLTPNLQRLLLTLLFLAAYVGDNIVYHLGPGLKGLACAGDSLIGAGENFLHAVLLTQGRKSGNVALDGAVALDGNKAAFGTKALFLSFDYFEMFGVYLGDYHGDIGSPAVGAVVGDNGAFELCVCFLKFLYLFLVHVDGAEYEVHFFGDLLHILNGVLYDDALELFGHGGLNGPSLACGFFIGLACATCTCCNDNEIEPGVTIHKGDKTLSDHTGAANNAYFIFFHTVHPFRLLPQ